MPGDARAALCLGSRSGEDLPPEGASPTQIPSPCATCGWRCFRPRLSQSSGFALPQPTLWARLIRRWGGAAGVARKGGGGGGGGLGVGLLWILKSLRGWVEEYGFPGLWAAAAVVWLSSLF